MRVVGVVAVRMGSGRLAGKVMLPAAGRPLLGHLLDRVRLSRRVAEWVVATSTLARDDVIADYARGRGIPCFRGDEADVAGRVQGALRSRGAEAGVQVFGDGPLVDPAVVDRIVGIFLEKAEELDFAGSDLEETYPPGQEVEAFHMAAFERALALEDDPAAREHSTWCLRRRPDVFRLLSVKAPDEHRRPDLSTEVDTPEDLALVRAVAEHFADRALPPPLSQIIAFLDGRPDLVAPVRAVHRRWREVKREA